MRCQAPVIAAAQASSRGISTVCAGRRARRAAAQCPGLSFGEVAVQSEVLEPGEQDLAGFGGVSQAWLMVKSWDGSRPMPVSLPVRMASGPGR
jgi:hypothetical protein